MNLETLRKYTTKEKSVHIFMYGFGVFFIPAGIVLTINSHFGAGGLDALNFAFGELIHVRTSISIFILGFVFMCLAALIRRQRPRPLTFMASVFQGIFVDVWKIILADVQGTGWVDGLLLFLLGNVVIAIAAAPYFISFFPPNPGDDLTQAISERGIRFGLAKILFEVATAVVAFFLHGEISIGTVILIVILGPMIDFFIVRTKKILDRGKIRYGLDAQTS